MKLSIQTLFRGFLFFFIVSIVILEFPGARDLVYRPYSGLHTQNLAIQNIDENGPNQGKGIQFGDEIYKIDGEIVRNTNHYMYLLSRNTSSAPQIYTFLRDSEEVDVEITYTPIPSDRLFRRFTYLVVAFTFIFIGVFVYIRRSDLLAALFVTNCTIIAFMLTQRPAISLPFLQLVGELFHDAMILLFPAVFLNFFLVFPDRYRPDGTPKEIRRMAWIYVFPALLFIFDCYLVITRFASIPTNQTGVNILLPLSTIYMALYLLSSLVIFIRNYRSSPAAQKVKLRLVIVGTTIGIVPFLFTIILRQIVPGARSPWELFAAASLVFISVSFAYAILKHGAIEVNIVVRKSLVYAFLTGAIIAVYYMLVNILESYLSREYHLSHTTFWVFSVMLIAITLAPARDAVQRAVDRLFYRGDIEYKREVVEFNRRVAEKLTQEEILDYFFEKLESLFKCAHIAFYQDVGKNTFAVRKEFNCPDSLPLQFPIDSALGRFFWRRPRPLMVEYIDRAWEKDHLDAVSNAFLTESGSAVCLPVASPDSFFGLVVLGRKRSGALYTKTESELLQTFAEHLGLVLENAKLLEASIEKERLKNEVMLARDIQLSLLPEKAPKLASFDILGKMMSSSEVGGDYYDYFEIDKDTVAVALCDVSGNGIPAAMLVFSIQAVFKNLVAKGQYEPGEINRELNNYLSENAKPGQFACFFYGILNTKTSTLTFSNAGQYPALLVKDDFVDRLGEGGVLLGVEPNQEYQEGTVKLEPGNVLCLYTDGIVEQKNPNDEEFGLERLIEFLQKNRNLPLDALLEELFATVLAFGKGSHEDDTSCVIISYKRS